MSRIAASLAAASVTLACASVVHADDRADGYVDPEVAQRWTAAPLTVAATALIGTKELGGVFGTEVDFAPMPWLYASAVAGSNGTALAYGTGLHVRDVRGRIALELGAGLLYSGPHNASTSPDLFSFMSNNYSYSSSKWATLEAGFEARGRWGMTVRLAVGLDTPLATESYSCVQTDLFTDPQSCGSGTTNSTGAHASLTLGFSPKIW